MVLRATPQKREEKERVRHALLRAALSLGAVHGFASLGLREVARAANIAPTSFYRHFADMPELGLRLVEELVEPFLRDVTSHAGQHGAGSPTRCLVGLVDSLLAAASEDPELARFLVAERVGVFAPLRRALAEKLELLALALCACAPGPARKQPLLPQTAEASLAVVLDGLSRAIELSPDEGTGARERLVSALELLLQEPRNK